MKEVYVVNCCRTAIGSFGGSLKDTPAAELGAVVIKEALNRAGVKAENVDEVMFGCILTAGLGQNPARQAALKAGVPISVPAYTVGMVCGSGMKSVIEGARAILTGDADIILASGEAVEKYGLKPMAKLVSWGQGGVDPKIMGVGPVPASRQAMEKAGLKIEDMDLVEANEAFAAQSIAVARELGFDMSKVNVNGGAIALGHPVGASGARIIVTLLHEMAKRPEAKKGLATLCIGGGMGVATIFEKC